LHIGVCITDNNFRDLPNLVHTLNKEGIYKIFFYPFYYSPRNVNKDHVLYKKRNKTGKIFTEKEIVSYRKIVSNICKNTKLDLISKILLKKSIDYFNGEQISLRELPCHAPLFSTVIGFDGEVSPCWYSKKVLGNIYQDSFKKIWYSKDFIKIRDQIRNQHCSLTKNNCLITQRETSARIDLFFQIRNYINKFF